MDRSSGFGCRCLSDVGLLEQRLVLLDPDRGLDGNRRFDSRRARGFYAAQRSGTGRNSFRRFG